MLFLLSCCPIPSNQGAGHPHTQTSPFYPSFPDIVPCHHSRLWQEKVTNMSHQKAMAHIRQASWPLVLRFRLPLEERDVFSLSKIADMRCFSI